MAKVAAKTSTFKIDVSDGGALTDITSEVVRVGGLPTNESLVDITALGDAGRKSLPSDAEEGTFDLELLWDPAANKCDPIFGVLWQQTRTFEYSPDGGTTKYTGECWKEKYSVESRVGEIVKANATLRVDGTVTRS